MTGRVSVMIPTWNGRHLLERHLSYNVAVIEKEAKEWELIVVDNGSTDGTIGWLRQTFGDHSPVKWMALPRNIGYGEALNRAIEAAAYPTSYVLNNDVRLVSGSLKPLFGYLADDVFAVYPWQRIVRASAAQTFGATRVKFSRGMFRVGPSCSDDFLLEKKVRPSWYASGAAALFATEKLRLLGGFAAHFSPAYWEDVDISHRAWRRGWKVLSIPTPPVDHWHESTAKTISPWRLHSIQQRNWWIFQWSNISDPAFWARHIFWLPANFLQQIVLEPRTILGLAWAVWFIPEIIAFRRRQVWKRSDSALVSSINGG